MLVSWLLVGWLLVNWLLVAVVCIDHFIPVSLKLKLVMLGASNFLEGRS